MLGPAFFGRDTLRVARALVGHQLCRRQPDGRVVRWVITETEAYIGLEDKACHAARGKTPRNAVMFGSPGHWYVYLCYGVHWLLNIITEVEGFPAAVLIRGAGERDGPGKLTKALGITKTENLSPATPESGLWVEGSGRTLRASRIEASPRIGIDSAGEPWVSKPWRYLLKS